MEVRPMSHDPFASLDEMLSVDAMSALERRTVSAVDVDQWQPQQVRAANSNSEFLKVSTHAAGESRCYFVKRTRYATDMIRRLTDDYACRERLLWEHGVLECLPSEITSPMLAHACDA